MRRQSTVTATHFGVGTTSGDGINGYILNIYRHHRWNPVRNAPIVDQDGFRFKSQRGDLDGTVYPDSESAARAALEHGYTKIYQRGPCRNLHGFVMSRAARKRGYATDDIFYRMGIEKGQRILNGSPY